MTAHALRYRVADELIGPELRRQLRRIIAARGGVELVLGIRRAPARRRAVRPGCGARDAGQRYRAGVGDRQRTLIVAVSDRAILTADEFCSKLVRGGSPSGFSSGFEAEDDLRAEPLGGRVATGRTRTLRALAVILDGAHEGGAFGPL